jgi:hypothetical protein
LLDSDYYWAKFATGESRNACSRLEREADPERLAVGRCMFPTLQEDSEGTYKISVIDFITNGGELSTASVENGLVALDKQGFLRMFGEAAKRRIRARISVPANQAPQSFVQEAASLGERLKELAPVPQAIRPNYAGSYLSLPCVQASINHTPEGKRYYACLSICIACRKDGLDRQAALGVLQTFVNNAGKSTHEYTLNEALSTLEWVYRKNINFSCKMQRAHGLAPAGLCGPPCELEKAGRGGRIALKGAV